MKILLDMCCIIWAIAEPNQLPAAAERACAVERERIALKQHWKTWFHKYVDLNAWQVEPIGLDIMEEAYSLPGQFHADPVDRILVATARLQGQVLLTADRKILDYPHVKAAW